MSVDLLNPSSPPAGPPVFTVSQLNSRVKELLEDKEDDVAFAQRLVSAGGVSTDPGSSFYHLPSDGATMVRFCFSKRIETLERAAAVLRERLG